MQGKDYIFAIQDKDFNFYQINGSGNVVKSSQPYFLAFAPSGWENIAIQCIRNKTYWALDRSVTIPFDYVGDGARIIKDVFYDLDLEKGLFLSILSQQLDFDVVKGSINISALLPDVNNTCEITGGPGETVYLKLTPTTSDVVDIFIDPGDGMYHQFGQLSGGNSSVFPMTIPESGSFSFILYFSGAVVNISMSTQHGNSVPEYGFWYQQIFRGEIDLTEFTHAGFKVTAPTLEDGISKYLKANEKTEYEFPFDDFINVKLDGIRMHNTVHFNVMPLQDGSKMYLPYEDNKALGVTMVSQDGDSANMGIEGQINEQFASSVTDYIKGNNCLLRNFGASSVSINISGVIKFHVDVIVPYDQSFKLYFKTSAGAEFIVFNARTYEGETYTPSFNFNISLALNEKLFLLGYYPDSEVGFSGSKLTFLEDSNFGASFITRREPTFCKAFRPQKLFEKLISKVTDGYLTAGISNFLTQHQNIVITSSNAIRNLENATLKLTFADFFKLWDSIFSVAMTKDIRIELKQDAIDFTNPIELPSPENASMNISIDKEYLFNELNIGYHEIGDDVGTLNGNEEFNSKFIFSFGATAEPKVLDKISPVKASCYVIEKIRITQLDKDTTAYSSDNDTFVLHVESILHSGNGNDIPDHYELDRQLNSSATGLLEAESVFNLALSPKRMLINNGAFIHSSVLLNESRQLKFISADKNDKLQSGGIAEKEDIALNQMKPRFFHPVVFSFQVAPPLNLDELLSGGRGFVFPFNGVWFYGIPNNIAYSTNKSLRSFKLLSYALNDLKQLKSYNG